jgi:hypothetical protein
VSDERFLSRWARLKRQGERPLEDAAAVAGGGDPVAPAQGVGSTAAVPAAGTLSSTVAAEPALRGTEPALRPAPGGPEDESTSRPGTSSAGDLPTPSPLPAADADALPDLASLTPESDFRPFMRAGVDAGQRNAALHKLFADPHYNQMDGLDVYIDDYSRPDPIPPAMLRMLNQARTLGLFGEQGMAPDAAADDASRATGMSVADESVVADSPGAEAAADPVPANTVDGASPQVHRADPIPSEHDAAIAADTQPDLESGAPASLPPGSVPAPGVPPVGAG